MSKAFVFGCLLALVASCVGGKTDDGRIVNGVAIPITSAPWQVQLRKWNQQFCGGTLVRADIVVTAAHCFDGSDYRDVSVVAGVTMRQDTNGVERKIKAMRKPTGYTSANMHNDFAVLKLTSPMPLSGSIKFVSLCSSALQPGNNLFVSGWGDLFSGGSSASNLQAVQVPVISQDTCITYHKKYVSTPITDAMFCAYAPNKDSCQGDSGGPAIFNNQLCGIVSWGLGCAEGPGIYTNVYNLKSSINQFIRELDAQI